MSTTHTSTESRALTLLGSGVSPEQVAAALGVTPSTISQLLSRDDFALQVSQLRYEALSKHNLRDATYDALEDALLLKLKDLLPLMMRPMEILKALQTLNGAKRRGASAPEQITSQQNIVNIVIPTTIINKFVTNSRNQVIQTGTQELETMQSGSLLRKLRNNNDTNDNARTTISQEGNRERQQSERAASSQQEEGRLLANFDTSFA